MDLSQSPEGPYREFTLASAIVGVTIGCVMTAAFVYVCLKLGFGLGGSTVAAILGFAILKGVLKKGTIVENNINQTIASGVNNASAGVAFTLPALFIMHADGKAPDFDVFPIVLAALGGSFLGIVFIIPLRKQMIEFERLRFPSGIAVASLLKSPGAGARQAVLLLGGFAFAAFFHILVGVGVLHEEIELGSLVGLPAYAPVAVGISFASIGAGLLSGKGGLPFVGGGVLAWWVIAPVAVLLGWMPQPEDLQLAQTPDGFDSYLAWDVGYFAMLRPMGIGILIGGALSGVIASFPAIRAALKGLAAAAKSAGGSDEMSPKVLYGGICLAFVVLFLAAIFSSEQINVGQATLTAIVGTIWLALAGLIVAQATGMTDISPLSGMSLIGVTLMFFLSGGNVVTAVVLGIAVCIGIGQCADMMSDLKAGHLIGAQPKRQQMAQFMVAWIGVPVAIGVIYLLWSQGEGGINGFGPANAELSAPQGTALAAIIESLQQGASPLDKYVSGGFIGLALGIYPIGGLGVLIGLAMYLPLYITLTYGVGCLVSIFLEKRKGARWMAGTLVPVAAGFIIGEALTSLSIILIKLVTG